MFSSDKNDGTIAITSQVVEPMQGTFIGEVSNQLVVNKGIVRPPLKNPYSGEVEKEDVVAEASFGKNMPYTGKFYRLKETSGEKHSLAYQTNLFSNKYASEFIQADTEELRKANVIDMMGRDARIKVSCGVHPCLLIEDMAPWDLLRRYKTTKGVRAVVYGSTLVPYEINAGKQFIKCFKLLPKSALGLANQLNTFVDDLIGRIFIIHRDPALPDGTSFYKAMFCGTLEWCVECKNEYGIVLNPIDSNWKDAGGDFDGDAASIYVPSKILQPTESVKRTDYKTSGKKYVSDIIEEQMIASVGDTVAGLLGPTILGAMRLFERGYQDDKNIRKISASVAQASVQAKKHPVDNEKVRAAFEIISEAVSENSQGGEYPYISDFTNTLKNAKGIDGKLEIWKTLMDEVEIGTWDEGTDIEKALVDRIKVVNNMFLDVEYFKRITSAKLPQAMKDVASSLCTSKAEKAVIGLKGEYQSALAKLEFFKDIDIVCQIEKNDIDTVLASDIEHLNIIRQQFRYACITGSFPDGTIVEPREAQIAIIAFGIDKLAARFVPASIFEELGGITKRTIISLYGVDWEEKEYPVENIIPVDDDKMEFLRFIGTSKICNLEIIKKSEKTTRVILTASG